MGKRVSIYIDGANFVYGLKYVKNKNKKVEVISFDELASRNLINEADKFTFINKKTANKFFWRNKIKQNKN